MKEAAEKERDTVDVTCFKERIQSNDLEEF